MQNIDTTKKYNIEDFINTGKDNSYNLENTNFYNEIDGIQIPVKSIFFETYRGLILNNCIKVKMSDKKLNRYRYRPKLLSYDLYGTTDLWHLILWINNMYSVTQFNESSIYIFNPDKLNLLVRIINNETSDIIDNKNNIPVIDNEKIIRR